jgi:hypothetical protein
MAPKLFGLIIFFGVAAVFASVAVASLRQLRPWGLTFPGAHRDSSPVVFWAYVGACTCVAFMAAVGAIVFAFQPV